MRKLLAVAVLALAGCASSNASVSTSVPTPTTTGEAELYFLSAGIIVPMPGDSQRGSTTLADPDNTNNTIEVNTLTFDGGDQSGVTVLFWQQAGNYDLAVGAESAGNRLQATDYTCDPGVWSAVEVVDCQGNVANGPVYTRTMIIAGQVVQVLVGASTPAEAERLFTKTVNNIELPEIAD